MHPGAECSTRDVQGLSTGASPQPRLRQDTGKPRRLSEALRQALQIQYQAHPGWSYKLHYDNLAVGVAEDATQSPLPSYATVRRYMKTQGLLKQRRTRTRHTPGHEAAEHRLQRLEVRSFEAEYVHALVHLDFHHGSHTVLTSQGRWVTPLLLGVLDDRSRLACHLQWYSRRPPSAWSTVCARRSRNGLCPGP